MENVIRCEHIYKKIGNKQILKDVSFNVDSGDILAFIGPNGAGKTTTIKLMLGLQKINQGEIYINNYNIKTDFVNAIKKVGAIVENPDSYMYLTGWENLKLAASLYNIHDDELIKQIVKKIGLENRINDKVSKYSLGMRQRLGIGIALINNPNILILDEPTNGLDPEGIHDLRDLLKSLAKEGIAIFISSHNLAELESFCTKVIIIQNGEIIEQTTTKELKKISKTNKYIIKLNDTKKLSKEFNVVADNLILIEGDEEKVSEAVTKLVNMGKKIYLIREQEQSLEEAFLKKTGGNKIV